MLLAGKVKRVKDENVMMTAYDDVDHENDDYDILR